MEIAIVMWEIRLGMDCRDFLFIEVFGSIRAHHFQPYNKVEATSFNKPTMWPVVLVFVFFPSKKRLLKIFLQKKYCILLHL
jgi:hypothetical protein